jgi:hypothetical protein
MISRGIEERVGRKERFERKLLLADPIFQRVWTMWNWRHVWNIFQSFKVFERSGTYVRISNHASRLAQHSRKRRRRRRTVISTELL